MLYHGYEKSTHLLTCHLQFPILLSVARLGPAIPQPDTATSQPGTTGKVSICRPPGLGDYAAWQSEQYTDVPDPPQCGSATEGRIAM